MKQKPLKATSSLASSASLNNKALPETSKGIKQRSKKMAKLYREERVPFVKRFLGEHPVCQVRWDDGCDVTSCDVHEIKPRSKKESLVPVDGDESNFLAVCRYCHRMIDTKKKIAKERGFAA